MGRLGERFAALRAQGRKALIPYLTPGFPTLAAADGILRDLERAGADVVEVGVPFSDPIADGPTIQYSSQKALQNGATLKGILRWTARVRRRSQIPLVLMSYLNPLHRMGLVSFAAAARAAGVDGMVVPDLIPEEAGPLREALSSQGIDLVHLAAPTTPPARRRMLARASRGFLYAVSLTGVTGARSTLPPGITAYLKALKKESPVPVAVGFGVSSAEHVRALAPHVDGVIVASALVRRLMEKKPLYPFVKSLRDALDNHTRRTHARP